jgi:hypothetical protein
MALKQFTIDESFICDQHIKESYSVYAGKNPSELTQNDLMRILKGEDMITSYYTQDHPMFTELREQLEREGYISIQRGWWNGDRVLKSFKLNEWTFRKGQKFSSAPAMRNSISCARQHGWKSISTI